MERRVFLARLLALPALAPLIALARPSTPVRYRMSKYGDGTHIQVPIEYRAYTRQSIKQDRINLLADRAEVAQEIGPQLLLPGRTGKSIILTDGMNEYVDAPFRPDLSIWDKKS